MIRKVLLITIPVFIAMTVIPAGTSLAGPGSARLSLDRAAIATLIRAGMPGPQVIEIPHIGNVTFTLQAPDKVEFREGGVEATVGFTLVELKLSGSLHLRYVPKVDSAKGMIRFVAASAVPVKPVALPIDLAPFLPPAEIPRSFMWHVEEQGSLVVVIEELLVGKEQLVLEFFLAENRPEKP